MNQLHPEMVSSVSVHVITRFPGSVYGEIVRRYFEDESADTSEFLHRIIVRIVTHQELYTPNSLIIPFGYHCKDRIGKLAFELANRLRIPAVHLFRYQAPKIDFRPQELPKTTLGIFEKRGEIRGVDALLVTPYWSESLPEEQEAIRLLSVQGPRSITVLACATRP